MLNMSRVSHCLKFEMLPEVTRVTRMLSGPHTDPVATAPRF